ncbi:hypothetical protein pb186bvf_003995 [Paramecium bursaria]
MASQPFLQKDEDKPQSQFGFEPETTFLDWLGILGMMGLTYLTIILIWIICMFGIEQNFVATVSTFMFIFFLIYVPLVAYLWYQGLQQREELIRKFIQAKIEENAVEIGAR